jgi:hypothetical protein
MPPTAEDVAPGEALEQAATMESHPQPSIEEVQGPSPTAVTAIEQLKEREKEPPVEAGSASEPSIVDIASLLGASTVIVV